MAVILSGVGFWQHPGWSAAGVGKPSEILVHLVPPVRPSGGSGVRLAAALALSTAPLCALAQDAGPGGAAEPAPGQQPSSVQRVEIAARQGSTELRRAASIAKQIYGREELDRHGDTNTLDVLRRLPGVNVDAGGPRMRGLGAGYTQILINGDPAPPGFALDQLSPSQIERIEVLRAPSAEQSAQAIAGTINIILKEAPRRAQRDLRLGLADGTDRPMANANLTLGESRGGLGLSLPLSVFEWNRENRVNLQRAMAGADGLPAEARQRGAQEVWGWGYNLGPRLNWRISDDQTLSLGTFFQKGFWNNRTDYTNQALAGDPVLEDDQAANGTWQNRRANLTWANRFRDDQRIELRAGVMQSRWTFDTRNLRSGALRQRSVGGGSDDGITQAGKYSLLLGSSHTLTAGWDLEHRDREERRTTTDAAGQPVLPEFEGQPFEAQVRRHALYVQDEWELSPQWQLYLGLRSERITTDSRGGGTAARNTSSVTSPLLHLTYKFDPKGRDQIRASLTRSYKAPNLGTLLPRPSINAQFPGRDTRNTQLAPDRIGNPLLKPELATGLDIAYENYLANGGLISIGLFHRRLTDVVRSEPALRSVSWATVQRWVSEPQNFSDATTSGLEFEAKGSAADLLPKAVAGLLPNARALNLRASVNLYRSRVAAIAGPDNRLDGQQPWSATLGFDQRLTSLPLNIGGSIGLNPAYDTRFTADQLVQRSRTRSIDLFAQLAVRPGVSVRLAASAGVQPFGPPNQTTTTLQSNGDVSSIERHTRPQLNLSLDMRL
ncbi:hypothetical protein AQPW35_39180 [Rubrivivax pictus]|uniref:TonB-dependent receptor n=1 Tax=Pseudaquabacterium pictum TaxID=2315236 RepID=A0A480AXJ4_9BURK|nr:hypothetical protein AQPW35_39180 [Rubrivivax pictus]